MSEQNFYLELVSKMTVKLGPEEAIQLDTNVIKNNGVVRKAVTIGKNGSSVRPTIYLENYYAKYKDGLPMNIIIDKIIEIYHGAIKEAGESVVDFVKDWERVKDKIVFYLVSKERNKGNLDKHIYEDFCDLAAITVVHVTSGEKDIGSLHVTPEMLKCWGVSKAEVLEKAHVNTERLFPAECFNITKMIMSMLGEEVAEVIGRTPCPVDLSILSNKLLYKKGIDVSINTVITQFEHLGLLQKDANKAGSRTKKVSGTRAYCIKYLEWRNYVKENYTELN